METEALVLMASKASHKGKYKVHLSPPSPIHEYTRLVFVVVNKSSCVTDAETAAMVAAQARELPSFCAAYNMPPVELRMLGKTRDTASDCLEACKASGATHAILLVDTDEEAEGAAGFHAEVAGGETGAIPYAKILAATVLEGGGAVVLFKDEKTPTVAQCMSHELYEMLVDLGANRYAQTPAGDFVALETADPVQDHVVVVDVDGTTVGLSNYVFPAYFDPLNTRGPFDRLLKLKEPFSMSSGGYLIKVECGRSFQVFGKSVPAWMRSLKSVGNSTNRASKRAVDANLETCSLASVDAAEAGVDHDHDDTDM